MRYVLSQEPCLENLRKIRNRNGDVYILWTASVQFQRRAGVWGYIRDWGFISFN
jgi:hypothetical protein